MAAFIRLWSDFHKKSSDRLREVYPADKEDLELIIWNRNNTFVKFGFNELDIIDETLQFNLNQNNHYAIQIWTNGSDVGVSVHLNNMVSNMFHYVEFISMQDSSIKMLADKGFNMIFSNYDSMNLDCGYGAWVGESSSWCSPYKGRKWRKKQP